MRHIERGGSTTQAEGVNLDLVGMRPLGLPSSVFGKAATPYAWRARACRLARDDGFGPSVGAGVSYAFGALVGDSPRQPA